MNLDIFASALENKLLCEVVKNNFLLSKERSLNYIEKYINSNDYVCVINNAMLLVSLLSKNHDVNKITFVYDDVQKKMLAKILGFRDEQLIDIRQMNNDSFKKLSVKNKMLTCMFYHSKNYLLLNMENVFNLHPLISTSYYENKNNFSKIKMYTIVNTNDNKIINNISAGSILKEVVEILEAKKREIFLSKIINNKNFKINNFHMCLDETLKLKLINENFTRTQTWGHKFSFNNKNIFYCTQFGYENAGKLCLLIKEFLNRILNIDTVFIEPQKNKL